MPGQLELLNRKKHAFMPLVRGKSSLIDKRLPVSWPVNQLLLLFSAKDFIRGKTGKRFINHH